MNKGIKYVTLSDEDLASFYDGKYKIDLDRNQYLFIKREGEVVDKFKWDGKEVVKLKPKPIESRRIGKIRPINDEQFALFDLLQDEKVTVKLITGVAGSGKNFCALGYALDMVDKREKDLKEPYKKVVLVRNNIEVKDSYNLGALPAGINEKLLPFAMPAADILGSEMELWRLIEDEKLEILHLGFARGRNFDNSIILVDECENMTGEHVALLVSRVGKDSVIMFLGDTNQVDKPVFEKNSGIERLNSRLFGHKLFGSVHLTKTERSETAALAALLQ